MESSRCTASAQRGQWHSRCREAPAERGASKVQVPVDTAEQVMGLEHPGRPIVRSRHG